jgi:hypothetical protein
MKVEKKTIAQKVSEEKQLNLREQLEKEEREKDTACLAEINSALDKYNRILTGTVSFKSGSATPLFQFAIARKNK